METISTLNNGHPFRKPDKKWFSGLDIIHYILFALILVFFAIPFAGLSLHYYKFGMPSRLLGFVDFFLHWLGQ